MGILTFFVAIINFEALKKGKLCVIEIIIELELPLTVLLGFVFFHETFSLQQAIVIILVFLGIMLIASKSLPEKKHAIEKGVFFGVLAAIGMALINFFTASAARTVSPLMAIWLPWVVFTVMSLFVIS